MNRTAEQRPGRTPLCRSVFLVLWSFFPSFTTWADRNMKGHEGRSEALRWLKTNKVFYSESVWDFFCETIETLKWKSVTLLAAEQQNLLQFIFLFHFFHFNSAINWNFIVLTRCSYETFLCVCVCVFCSVSPWRWRSPVNAPRWKASEQSWRGGAAPRDSAWSWGIRKDVWVKFIQPE